MEVSSGYYDAQRALIGAVLLEPRIAGELFSAVREDDYSVPELRTIFAAARELFLSGKSVDPVLIVSATSPAYDGLLREILRDTPTAANWKAYAKALREGAALRRAQELGANLQEAVNAEDARALLSGAQELLMDRPDVKTQSVTELLNDFLQRLNDRTPPRYLEWGLRQLDGMLTAEPGDFIVLGADSSVGKTALAVQIAWNMAAHGRRVGFFSLETSARKLTDRIVAQRAQVELKKIKHKTLTMSDVRGIVGIGSTSDRMVFDITEAAGFTVNDVRAVTLGKRYDVIFIDYAQLLQTKGTERWEIVTRISMELHTMAQQLGVAVIALSQLTPPDKRIKTRMPTKDDLRESRQLKQDADVILLMSLDDDEDNTGRRWLQVAKNKDGPCGRILLDFDAEHLYFRTMTGGDSDIQLQELPDGEQEEIPFD